ncbi:MAG: ParA family protein [Brevefilum sp.]
MNDIRKSERPFVFAVCQQKGGVGKTTTCASLGAELGRMEKKCLLIDLAPSGNLSSAFGFDLNELKFTTADLFHDSAPLSNLIYPTSIPELDLIPSNAALSSVPRELYQKENYETILGGILNEKDFSGYEFLILDCPPGMDSITVNAVASADLVILPLVCEYLALQTLDNMFRLIKLTRERVNPEVLYRLLITKMDRRESLHERIYAQIKDHYQDALLETIIGLDMKLPESQLAGVPTFIYDPKSQGNRQYIALTQELLDLIKTENSLEIENE